MQNTAENMVEALSAIRLKLTSSKEAPYRAYLGTRYLRYSKQLRY